MIEFGIWTKSGAGFTERDLHSPEVAADRLAEIIRESGDPEEDRADLEVKELCPEAEHADAEQPKDGCEMCEG